MTTTDTNFIATGTGTGFETGGDFEVGGKFFGQTGLSALATDFNGIGVEGVLVSPPSTPAEPAGVQGGSRDGIGVYGVSDFKDGVHGTGATGVAGIGSETGVRGNSKYLGVSGTSDYVGVFGLTSASAVLPDTLDSNAGVKGSSRDHPGVTGVSTNNAGVVGYSKTQIGVYGENGATGAGTYAGYFKGNLFVSGKIDAGIKDAVVPFPDGSHRLMHCMESPEHWFEDFGRARLKHGRAMVKLDADFAKVISPNDYRVFLTPEGDCQGLYYVRKRGNSFEVRELQGGTSSVAFSYRIVGQRRDIKRHKRFARIDITSPIMKPRTRGRTAAREQVSARKLLASLEKQAVALRAKPARGRKARSRRRRKARA